jgi:hypothetical protein
MLTPCRDVRLQGLACTQNLDDHDARLALIAALPNVAAGGSGRQTVGSETAGLLNRSAISPAERREAVR